MLGKRLKKLREVLNLQQKDIAKMMKVALRTYQYYENDEQKPAYDKIVNLVSGLREVNPERQVNLEWLLTGEGPMFREEEGKFEKEGYVPVEYYEEVNLSAGHGAYPVEAQPEVVFISEKFVRNYLKTTPGGLILFPVIGESMEPLIPDGAIAIVKKWEYEGYRIADGAVYAIIYENDLYVKEVRRELMERSEEGETWRWELISKNPNFKPRIVITGPGRDVNFRVIGRVVGYIKNVSIGVPL